MTKPLPDSSIIIVNWNGRTWLEQCLPALAAQTYRDFEIILFDNGSSDDSVPWLQSHWPQVRLLQSDHNLGFAAANNQAIQAAHGRFLILLNNDTQPEPEWLAELLRPTADPGVGMVAACILNWQHPHLLDSAGIEVDQVGIAWQRGWGKPVETAVTPQDVFGPSGAAALYRRDMLDQIGLFDEQFFAYYEDVDLAWRAQRAGWRCRYAPLARVRHWHSATAQRQPARKAFLLGRNKLWTISQNYPWPALLWWLPLICLADFLAVLYQLLWQRQVGGVYGRLAALPALPALWAKRPPTPHSTKVVKS